MAPETPLSKANTSFALALLKKLGDDNRTANVFCSPFSISSTLAMVMLGARGNTAKQMSEVLCFTDAEQQKDAGADQAPMQTPNQSWTRIQKQQSNRLPAFLMNMCLKPQNVEEEDVDSSFAQLLHELNKPGARYTLSIASRLYGEKSFQFLEDFLTQTRTHFDAELDPVDFINGFEEATDQINHWMEKQTQGTIKDVVAKDALSNMSRLVLVNAIYFKCNWDIVFNRNSTYDAQFKLNKTDKKPVRMMKEKTYYKLTSIHEAQCRILEMPYKEKELSMLIFLPNKINDSTTGLEKLEHLLSYKKFVRWTHPDNMRKVKVQLHLPRFKLEETYDLDGVLRSMGMVDAFEEETSDFSGMSGTDGLYVSKVAHKAFVEVNEEGTEAGAATYLDTTEYSLLVSEPEKFIADHPFLFFIRHNATMSILFAGRFCSPV